MVNSPLAFVNKAGLDVSSILLPEVRMDHASLRDEVSVVYIVLGRLVWNS